MYQKDLAIVGLLVVLNLCACVHGRQDLIRVSHRNLQQGSSTASGTAVADGGLVEVEVRAVSEAEGELKTKVIRVVADAVAKVRGGGQNARAVARAVADEIAEATATAIAAASVKVRVEGSGSASGSAKASSRAIARITVQAIAEAFAQADGESDATAIARSEIKESAVANAAANAVARAESTGGSAEANQFTIAKAIAQVIVRAIANALAAVKGSDSDAQADTSIDANPFGEASVDSQSFTSTGGCSILHGRAFSLDVAINDGSNDITGSDAECCEKCRGWGGCLNWTRYKHNSGEHKEGECWLSNRLQGYSSNDATNSGLRSGGGSAFASGGGDANADGR